MRVKKEFNGRLVRRIEGRPTVVEIETDTFGTMHISTYGLKMHNKKYHDMHQNGVVGTYEADVSPAGISNVKIVGLRAKA